MIFIGGLVAGLVFVVQFVSAIKCPEFKKCILKSDCRGTSIDGFGLLNQRFDSDENCDLRKNVCCDAPNPVVTAISPKCGFRASTFYGKTLREAEFGEFSWTVLISEVQDASVSGQKMNIHLCGGSLIHPSVILSAGHCVVDKLPASLTITAGELDTQTESEQLPHENRKVETYVIHPNFYKGGLHRDIALIFLKTPLQTAQHINFVCLPPQGFNFDESRCFAAGWGKDIFGVNGQYQSVLQKIELPIVPHDICQSSLRKTRLGQRYKLDESFICAGGEAGRDTCSGFGGSPLVCPIPGSLDNYYQAGIVSWGIGCGEENIPAAYTNVALFREWIDEQIELHGFDQKSYSYAL